MSRAIVGSAPLPLKGTPDNTALFSVRQLIRDPEAVPRQAFLDLLGRTWQQIGFEPSSFARDFLKYPPTRVVFVPAVTRDGVTQLERRVIVKGINQEPLDLHRLYCEVWKLEGFRNVTEKGKWQLVAMACNFLKAEALGKQLDLSQQRIIINTSNTYERYLFQFELRMSCARRILMTQARPPVNTFRHGCHYLHTVRGLVENTGNARSHEQSDSVAAQRRGIRCSHVMVSKPTIMHAYVETKQPPGPEADGKERRCKGINGANATGQLSGEVKDRGEIMQAAQIERYSSGPDEFHRHKKIADPGVQTSGDTLADFSFSNLERTDKVSASPSSSESSKATKVDHSPVLPWYWATQAQCANADSDNATLSGCAIQIPGREDREHIVPERYWAREGDRLGIRPANPEDHPVISKGFTYLIAKWTKGCGSTRTFGLLRRRRAPNPKREIRMPATAYSGVSFAEMRSRILDSDLSSSYLPVSQQGVEAKMTYRAEVEKY